MSTRTRAWIAWLTLLSCETLCQISLKMAGTVTGEFDFSRVAFVRALSTPWLWVAIGCYVGAFLSWLTILRKSTLSAAFATSAVVYVAVLFASLMVFGEHVTLLQVVGSVIIVVGILFLGDDESAPVPPSTAQPGSR